ncbi:MAG: Zn-dependent alcohol dehydrogenase [Actinobacteria bacterium]|nr:Zn-dependent alcohol dehydrogenase [Actinomycetota bacterium]NDG11055.1 Zn-dependent alcohol dehydrogenase [Actinomycetota bacterium]
MKAAVFREVLSPQTIEEIELDAPKGREILVRNIAAGICHSDLLFYEGTWAHPIPTILGHEVAGIVMAVGPDVTSVKPGDHIVGCAGGPCYECRYCVMGRPIICTNRNHDRAASDTPRIRSNGSKINQYGQLSGFAEGMLIHEHACVVIPKDIPLQLAAIIGCGVATGLGAVFNTARVEPGASVVVTGVGGVGLNAVQGARIAGASKVIAVDISDDNLALAKKLGATHLVNAAQTNSVHAIRDLTAGGADYVIETSGSANVAETAFEMLGEGAVLTLVGLPAHGTKISFDMTRLIPSEMSVRGCHVGSLRPRIDLPRYCEMYLNGSLDLESLVTRTYSLSEINEGFARLTAGTKGRGVVVF